MKTLLVTILFCEIFFLGYTVGQTNYLRKQINRDNACIQKVLNEDTNLDKFYNHKIEFNALWPHAEAYIALKYQQCLWRK